jgi:hypothetical protein
MTKQKPPSQPGCQWVEDCIEVCDGPSVYLDENGVQAWFRNRDRARVRKIHYDGCYNKTEGAYRADYILGLPGLIDIVIELKGSHSNLRHAYQQVVGTLEIWQGDPKRFPKLAALIIYGSIRTKDDLPRRRPKARSSVQAVQSDFLKAFRGKIRLFVHESGEKQFKFADFLRKNEP